MYTAIAILLVSALVVLFSLSVLIALFSSQADIGSDCSPDEDKSVDDE